MLHLFCIKADHSSSPLYAVKKENSGVKNNEEVRVIGPYVFFCLKISNTLFHAVWAEILFFPVFVLTNY